MSPRNTSRRHSSRRRPYDTSLTKKIALLSVPAAILVGGGALALHHISLEQIDENFCFARGDQAEISFFVDASVTAQSDQQLRDYRSRIEATYDLAPPNARLMAFTTARDVHGSVARPIAVQCKPASTQAELVALDVPNQSAAYLTNQARDARARFGNMIDRLISDTQDASKIAGESPILETIQSMSRYPGFQGRDRSLVVITDGIQNTETARFCQVKGDLPPFSTFSRQPRYQTIEPQSLAGVKVSFNLLETGVLPHEKMPYCSWAEIRAFYHDYFVANGASDYQLTRIRYGAGQ